MHSYRASQVVLVLKNLPANAGDVRNVALIPGWEDPLEKRMATHSSILAWRIPRTGGWRATIREVAKSRARLSNFTFLYVSAGKESACNVGDLGLTPGLERSPGEGKGYPLQYSGLENSMDCIVYGVSKSRT